MLVGYWANEVAIVPEVRGGIKGFRRYRPFRFVHERNPSVDWPEWYALTAILVDEGFGEDEPLPWRDGLEEVAAVVGLVRPWGQGARLVWDKLREARGGVGAPYGKHELPMVVSDVIFMPIDHFTSAP